MNPADQKNYWDLLARQFQHQQPPLRPCAEDVGIFERIISQHHRSSMFNALMLGVTPEIAGLNWPNGTQLLAVEKSQPMIDLIWPGNIPGRRNVIHQNWFDLELPEHSLDIVIGDGVLTAMTYPQQYQSFAQRIHRWLKPEGKLILRVFARTNEIETEAKIIADLHAGKIAKFDILKWRLAMMLQKNCSEGVELDAVYQAWMELEQKHPQLIARAGWPKATVETIRLYAGRQQRYSFPTLAELSAAFVPELKPAEVIRPGYAFGECCPIVVFQRAN